MHAAFLHFCSKIPGGKLKTRASCCRHAVACEVFCVLILWTLQCCKLKNIWGKRTDFRRLLYWSEWYTSFMARYFKATFALHISGNFVPKLPIYMRSICVKTCIMCPTKVHPSERSSRRDIMALPSYKYLIGIERKRNMRLRSIKGKVEIAWNEAICERQNEGLCARISKLV